jgi:hypothetical protein
MTSPEQSFSSPKLLLVSLNPSGTVEHGPRWSQEDGCAYQIENWGSAAPGSSPLQVQIFKMLAMLGIQFSEIASAHFVPFRSQRWADLERRDDAVRFSKNLWSEFSKRLSPDYVVCLGAEVGKHVAPMFGAELRSMSTGWGNISMSAGGTKSRGRLVVVPHLGTFKLFSNPNCTLHLRKAFGLSETANA